MTAVNLAATAGVLQRGHGVAAERVRGVIGTLLADVLDLAPFDAQAALHAADLRARHYHRSERPLSLADCVLLASAGATHRVATADAHVLEVARLEGIEAVALPGAGRLA